jgi:hypothetical protein
MKIKNPNIRLILDSHVQDWFLKEKERQERRKIPLIVISRIRGAGGLLVAEVLSRRLGWPYYDKNMIREIAALAGTAEQTVDFLDERDRNTFQEFANIFSQKIEGTFALLNKYLLVMPLTVIYVRIEYDLVLQSQGSK